MGFILAIPVAEAAGLEVEALVGGGGVQEEALVVARCEHVGVVVKYAKADVMRYLCYACLLADQQGHL